ncbi:uncharacterized protein K452DRAFT_218221 [Aplosporella prunicola CBS 121167]|uniref:ER membrane protein complex subunit 6 n=1 Tax=Aplosporella prunicola CBS 121167 TaxID=1176127 RepID=A0A6A6BS06_9PEZI|nr:uncharacterized protein K452DRAFT_218221 [Aplosporella prunicola CBS 121167]KAF2146568.1 hypothetical protein K452DRAFT_218221 [Aplosporella prunicola CBS 121167]
MHDERQLQVAPIVQESVLHNARTLSNIRNLTASLFGVAAGTLGLESTPGFLFYVGGAVLVSLLMSLVRARGAPGKFFYRPLAEFWMGDVVGAAMSFVLTWTLFYGLLRA